MAVKMCEDGSTKEDFFLYFYNTYGKDSLCLRDFEVLIVNL